jgi:DNA-binding NarL/FixJ family response regulator
MRVVIADDSTLICDRVLNMLSAFAQVEVVGIFRNGTDTLKALQTLNPDLAIVDIKMPGINGLEVLKRIRQEGNSLRFIILTFHATDDYRQLALEEGADYFFSKVDDFEKVEEVVKELVNRK